MANLNNKKDKTIFTEKNIEFVGKKGDMILFPSHLMHKVNKQKEDYERITFAFNVNRNELVYKFICSYVQYPSRCDT